MIRLERFVVVLTVAAVALTVPSSTSAQGDPHPRGNGGSQASGDRGGGNAGGGGGAVSSGNSGGGSSTSSGGGSSVSPGGGSSTSGGTSSGSWSGRSRGSESPGQNAGSRNGGTRQYRGGDSGRQSLPTFSHSRSERSLQSAEGSRRIDGTASGGQAVPWFTRPRGDRPPTGTAAGRADTGRVRPFTSGGGSGWDYWNSYLGYGNYYYRGYQSSYLRDCYPVGFGAFGLGYFFYDPDGGAYRGYGCSPYGSDSGGYYGGDSPTYGSAGRSSTYGESGIRLKIKPADAQVFVDGYFAGEVDEFDGVFQKLSVTPGSHRLEVRATGYQPLSFEVQVDAFQTVTYRGELQRVQ